MRKHSLIFLLFVQMLFSFCSRQTEKDKLDKKVQIAVDSLSKEKLVLLDETSENRKFKALQNIASNDDLVFLTEHDNALLRCYAFRGLAERNYSEIRELFHTHLKDTATVTVHLSGTCTRVKMPVHGFMLDQLHPSAKCKYKLSRSEYDKYFDNAYKIKSSH
ncbi:hypothetical protein [Flavobacterium terrisoli]|uniref:hypothetical protein n=1 Tax=Flavobacterium terrisoli TaxID=3242195 RepID=UPI0025435A31|nr:hypothetical protein [Flavobacterium buctense]